MKKKLIHEKGQYFTTNEILKEGVLNLIYNNPDVILEPSIGQGDLVEYISKNMEVKFDKYEIDNKIKLLDSLNKDDVIYCDFLMEKISKKYDTIVGNPPFVKRKGGNLYIDFIKKCYNLLNDNGELIFIVPSEFMKLTCASNIINEMLDNGMITDIIHPNNENLFKNASIDVIIFRYCKNKKLENKVLMNNEEKYLMNTNGIITFTDLNINSRNIMHDYFSIYVGMVTGKEDVLKNEKYGNINLLNGKDKIDKYIFINEFPTENIELNEYMLSNKDELISRRIRSFNDKNWFEWGAPRNYSSVEKNKGKMGIYIYTLTRRDEVAFIDKVQHFGGGLILLIPKKEINLKTLVDYLNSKDLKKNYMYSGRFKIGHKQVSNILF